MKLEACVVAVEVTRAVALPPAVQVLSESELQAPTANSSAALVVAVVPLVKLVVETLPAPLFTASLSRVDALILIAAQDFQNEPELPSWK